MRRHNDQISLHLGSVLREALGNVIDRVWMDVTIDRHQTPLPTTSHGIEVRFRLVAALQVTLAVNRSRRATLQDVEQGHGCAEWIRKPDGHRQRGFGHCRSI
jgi:hypothetical protein